MLSPEEVAVLSDADLSEHVARQVFGAKHYGTGQGLLNAPVPCTYQDRSGRFTLIVAHDDEDRHVSLNPDDPASVLLVMDHMRQRWAESGLAWWETKGGKHGWFVRVSGAVATDAQVGALRPTLGRAVFEVALLSAQEMASDAE